MPLRLRIRRAANGGVVGGRTARGGGGRGHLAHLRRQEVPRARAGWARVRAAVRRAVRRMARSRALDYLSARVFPLFPLFPLVPCFGGTAAPDTKSSKDPPPMRNYVSH